MTRPIAILFFLVLALTLLSKPHLATNAPMIADEFTEIHMGASVARGELPYGPTWHCPKTPGLSFLLALPSLLSNDGQTVVLYSRLLMIPIALLLVAALWYTALALKGREAAFLAVILLCTCTTFIDRSFRLRTDLVSTTCWAWSLYFFLGQGKRWSFFQGGIFLGVAFLFTQKAVYFLVAAFFICLFQEGLEKKRALGEYVVGILVILLGYVLFFSLLGLGWECIAVNFKAVRTGLSGFYRTWTYGIREFWRSPFFWLFGLLGLLWEGREKRNVPLLAATVVLLLLTIKQSSKWPYYYLKLLPCTALLGSLFLSDSMNSLKKRYPKWGVTGAVLLLFVLLCLPALWRFSVYLGDQAMFDKQLATIAWVESVTKSDDVFFDGVGLVPTRPRSYRELFLRDLILYRQGKYPDLIEVLRQKECKVHIANYRTNNLPEREKSWLKKHFIRDWGNVYVAGTQVDFRQAGSAIVDLHCRGTFMLSFGNDQAKLTIDGAPRKSGEFVTLLPGKHDVKVDRSGRFILRYRASCNGDLPFQNQPVERLFATYEM